MNRFVRHYAKRIPLSDAAVEFLRKHGKVQQHEQLVHFRMPDMRMPYWCVILEGMACGYTLDAKGYRRIRWFAMEMQGFTGVRHLYTPKPSEQYIQFTERTTILRIPALRMREGKERFPEINELLHVMKQQYINQQDKLVSVLQQPTTYERFAEFMRQFPDLARRTTSEQQMDFINMGHSQFFGVRRLWLRQH